MAYMENNPSDKESSFNVKSIDDMMSDSEKILAELLYSEQPVTSREIADKTGADIQEVGKIGLTLVNAGYLLTDSRSPGLDENASFYPDPIVSQSLKKAKAFRAADSKEEINKAITEHRKVLSELKEETGYDSSESYNNAVFDSDTGVENSKYNKDKAMKWIILEGQLETLEQVADEYEKFEDDGQFLNEEFGFNPESIEPPSMEKQEHLEPELSFPI